MEHKGVMGARISEDDLLAFSREIADGQTIKSEDFSTDSYLDEVIDKPWGHEYRIYSDLLVDVWRLSIAARQSTSMHCHPRKETVLICLHGDIRVNFIRSSQLLPQGSFISIPKGVFHSTDSIGESGAELIEVETPRNKFDLVRVKDRYGRQGQRYETAQSLHPITPMRPDSLHPYAKLRSQDLRGDFSFSIASGNAFGAAVDSNAQFAISLSLEDAIAQKINVVPLAGGLNIQLRSRNPYLVVTRNQA